MVWLKNHGWWMRTAVLTDKTVALENFKPRLFAYSYTLRCHTSRHFQEEAG
jgi:hypothetical protein